MRTITDLYWEKGVCSVKLEGEESPFLFDRKGMEVLRLRLGECREEDQLRALSDEAVVRLCRKRAVYLLSRRGYTKWELEQKLTEAFHSASAARAIADEMAQRGYLDEEALARVLARQCFLHKHWGADKTLRALRQKGLPDDICRQAIESECPPDQEEQLCTLVRSRYGRKLKEKGAEPVVAALCRRGYSLKQAWQAVKTVESEEEAECQPWE